MLIFSDIKIGNVKFSNSYDDIINILIKKLTNVDVKASFSKNENEIVLNKMDKNKLFMSKVENRIPLKPDDSRIKKLGRHYLLSDRLTEEQWDKTMDIIYNTLPKLGVSFSLHFREFDNDSESLIPLVLSGNVVSQLPKPNSFTLSSKE